jgi:hypothetical protein
MDSLFSFPVGLFHPLQHAGLSRRTRVARDPDEAAESASASRLAWRNVSERRLGTTVGIPVKLNAHSGGKPNGIPG